MKMLVKDLPNTCGECSFCADAMMMTPLGVQKQICLCTVTTALIPQDPQQPPKTIEKSLTPSENGCIFEETNTGKIVL